MAEQLTADEGRSMILSKRGHRGALRSGKGYRLGNIEIRGVGARRLEFTVDEEALLDPQTLEAISQIKWGLLDMALLYKISLLSGVEPAAFEQFQREQIFNKDKILRRNVGDTRHRLFKCNSTGSANTEYIWLVFAEMVGGGTELRQSSLSIQDLSQMLAQYATIDVFDEMSTPE